MKRSKRAKEMFQLPDGSETSVWRVYVREWRKYAREVGDPLGLVHDGFDPGVSYRDRRNHDKRIEIPHWLMPRLHAVLTAEIRTSAPAVWDAAIQAAIDLIRLYWSFDDGQRHTHTWHHREDCIEKLQALLPGEAPSLPRPNC